MAFSRLALLAIVAFQTALLSGASADDGRAEERDACMRRTGNRMFCECRILVNPRYPSGNLMAKIIFSQKCDQMFGHALYR